jgi:hypothetical protein
MDMQNTLPLTTEPTEATSLLSNGNQCNTCTSVTIEIKKEKAKKGNKQSDDDDEEEGKGNKKSLPVLAQIAIAGTIAIPTIYLSYSSPQSLLRHYMARALGDSVNGMFRDSKWFIKYGALSLLCGAAYAIDTQTGAMFLLGELGSTLLARPLTRELRDFLGGGERKERSK